MTYPFMDPNDAPWTPEYRDTHSIRSGNRNFPCQIGARTFETQEEYDESLQEFLNVNGSH